MQNNKYIKLYAAFKAGYMGQNILNTYFPFFANILHEKHIEVIDEYLLQKEFHNKYNFEPIVPYVFILVKLEFVKAKYAAQVTKGNIIYLTFAVIISLVVAFLYIQLKKIIVILVRKVMSKYK